MKRILSQVDRLFYSWKGVKTVPEDKDQKKGKKGGQAGNREERKNKEEKDKNK